MCNGYKPAIYFCILLNLMSSKMDDANVLTFCILNFNKCSLITVIKYLNYRNTKTLTFFREQNRCLMKVSVFLEPLMFGYEERKA